MSNKVQAIRGMNDILPLQNPYWHFFEEKCRQLAKRYGYYELRTPILEKTELFKRSIGEVTDIVEKEMYTFEDRNGDSLTMRPEVTASCVRAVIEHGLAYNQVQRLWSMGPIFRHERPQKGRYRQFYQFDVEVFGLTGPDIDAELILMTATLWREIGLQNVELQLNTLGSPASRQKYKEQLVNYLSKHINELDEDSKRRLQTNPLRILDSKNPAMQSLIENAPKLSESLDSESIQHFEGLKLRLQKADIQFVENPRLVRGLDYYTGMVFEWVTKELGAQGTICAGGRFDGLVEQLGGQATPAVGFALGCERVIELMQQQNIKDKIEDTIDVYMILVGEQAEIQGLALAEKIRQAIPQLSLLVNCGGGNFKKQFAKADKSGAKYAVIIGEEEIQQNKFALKWLREERAQESFSFEELIKML